MLVGPNASGKSNFLDVIAFLGDAVREDLRPAIEKRGGFNRVFYRGSDPGSAKVEIGVEAIVTRYASDAARDAYTMRFSSGRMTGPDGSGTGVAVLKREEEFQFKRTAGGGRRLTISGSMFMVYDEQPRAARSRTGKAPGARPIVKEDLLRTDSLGLSTLPRLAKERGGEQIGQIAALFSTFRVFNVDVAAARNPSPVAHRDKLMPDARTSRRSSTASTTITPRSARSKTTPAP